MICLVLIGVPMCWLGDLCISVVWVVLGVFVMYFGFENLTFMDFLALKVGGFGRDIYKRITFPNILYSLPYSLLTYS